MDADEFLEQSGIVGMKWGVLNKDDSAGGNKAPTKDEQASRDSKAKKFTDKAQTIQTKIDKIDQRGFSNPNTRQLKINLTAQKNQALKDAESKRQGKLSHRQKTVLIGAGAAAAILTAYGVSHLVQSGEMNRLGIKGKAFLHGEKPSWKVNEALSRDMTPDAIMSSVVSKVNPGYGAPGTKMNCRRATFAYEMRRRGFDVSATRTTNARGQDVAGLLNAVSPGKDRIKSGRFGLMSEMIQEGYNAQKGKITETPLTDAISSGGAWGKNTIRSEGSLESGIFKALRRQPNGARGELGVQWSAGGGHSMAWEIIGGKPHIFDAQSSKMYKSATEMVSDLGNVSEAGFTRLDNIPLNDDFLLRWLQHA